MNVLLISILGMVSYFLLMLILCILAICLGKWRWLIIGASFQLMSLIGNQYAYEVGGIGAPMTAEWVVFFIILIITALMIPPRKKHLADRQERKEHDA